MAEKIASQIAPASASRLSVHVVTAPSFDLAPALPA
jgi:hypothetical protein